ncbi:MAG: hypothetical protein DHS20C13_29620 [Thermodesulfobacteriota bacterium]|nr:MAG: hypothetical protein DHS20C13_29620 [Thermodesulfobacteriota bacterium]
MDIGKWAEIHRLKKIEGMSNSAIAKQMGSCHKTVAKALSMEDPKKSETESKSILDPFHEKIDEIIQKYPTLSGVRVYEKLIECGYQGKVGLVRTHLKKIRPVKKKRVYMEVNYDPAEAMQIDWGSCDKIQVGNSLRKLYVFVAVLCYSRMIYIEFTLSMRKEEFYRCIVNSLNFFQGIPSKIIIDNLKTAVVEGGGRNAKFHPEFLALCGHYLIEPIACAVRDPESKGRVEDGVKYVKNNALAGYDEKLVTFDDYRQHASFWRDEIANVRIHGTTRKKPIDLFAEEKTKLRALPERVFDSDIVIPIIATPMARVNFDCNKYSVPPTFARKSLTLRANDKLVKIFDGITEIAMHIRSFEKGKLFILPEHQELLFKLRKVSQIKQREAELDSLCPEAKSFRLELVKKQAKPSIHIQKILKLTNIYGNTEVAQAINKSFEFHVFDSAYIENLILQYRRKKDIPSPIPLSPIRKELIEEVTIDPPNLSEYDDLFGLH